MARLVKTHSTYIEGLIPLLTRLSKDKNIKTITPGVITSTRAVSKGLTLRISRETDNGYKINARKGKSTQEIYIITKCSRTQLEKKIKDIAL